MIDRDKTGLEVLRNDLALLSEMLEDFSEYSFCADVLRRMEAAGLSANALSARLTVSHTAVGNWISGEARPQGKERMKTLGMALGLSEAELDAFLYANGYPRLYAKNPLDNACRLMIKTHRGRPDIVLRYLAFLKLYCDRAFLLSDGRFERGTEELNKSFEAVESAEAYAAWIERNSRYFGATARTVTAGSRLMHRVWLYIGESSINDLYTAAEMPLPVRNLLYALLGNREMPVKGLRSKLIAFGLYENMIEEEMDLLLADANLRGLSEPKTRMDQLLLTAVRTAHEHYPYYEYETMEKLTTRIRSGLSFSRDRMQTEQLAALLAPYAERLENAALRAIYYDNHKGPDDERFEEYYTSRADRGLLHYLYDVLMFFSAKGAIDQTEADEMTALLLE